MNDHIPSGLGAVDRVDSGAGADSESVHSTGAVQSEASTAHTSGPWKTYSEQGVTGPTASPAVYWPRDIKWVEVTKGSEVVAYIARSKELLDEQHANARLIAAAPDLLAELRKVEDHLHTYIEAMESVGASVSRSVGRLAGVRAAIAAATGGKTA